MFSLCNTGSAGSSTPAVAGHNGQGDELCCSTREPEAWKGVKKLGNFESDYKDSQAPLTRDSCPQLETSQIPTEGVCRDGGGEEGSND